MAKKLRVSAKAINMFGALQLKEGRLGGCPRQWAAHYLDMIRPEFLDPALVFGIKYHAVQAALVKTQQMPAPRVLQPGVELTADDVLPESQFGKMARAGQVYLPENFILRPPEATRPILRAEWLTEQEWLFPWTTDHGVECDVDLRPDVCAFDPEALIELVDWKSALDKRYTLISLVDDVQANLYAYGLMTKWQRDMLRAHWIYTLKPHPHRSWDISSVFKLDSTAKWLHINVDPTIELIATIRDNPAIRALDLPGDEEACQGRGFRCDFAGQCLELWGPKEPRLITLDEVVRFKKGS